MKNSNFSVARSPSFGSQFWHVFKTTSYIKWREPAATISFLILLGFMSFILIALHLSFTVKTDLNPEAKQLPTLNSFCTTSPCYHLGYTNKTNVDPFIASFTSLVAEAESGTVNLKNFANIQEMQNFHTANPTALVVGLDLTNVTSALIIGATGLSSYQIFVNESSFLFQTEGVIDSGYTTALLYVERALQNVYRKNLGLPPLSSPLRYSDTNGVKWIWFSIRNSGGFLTVFTTAYFSFMFYIASQNVIQRFARDKEKQIKLGLMMIGLNDTTYLAAVVLSETVFNIPALALLTLLFFVGGIFTSSSWIMFFLMLILFFFGNTIQASLFSVPIKAEKFSNAVGFLLMISSIALTVVGLITTFSTPVGEIIFMLLMPVVAMARGVHLMKISEMDNAVPVNFANATEIGITRVAVVLIIDVVLWGLLSIYLNKMFPGDDLPRPHPLFFLQRSFWNPYVSVATITPEEGDPLHAASANSDNVEAVDLSLLQPEDRSVIRISKVKKEFKIPKTKEKPATVKTAVNDVSFDLHNGSCLALLGHGGAGKTTLINMMSGAFAPTAGSISIRITPAKSSTPITLSPSNPATLPLIRMAMGVCPQFECLYPTLTCREHLELISGIKGVKVDSKAGEGGLKEYIEALLEDVGLESKIDQVSSTLSGGQKRKLSLAMALCGNPQILLLDEPTTGMDVHSTQTIWLLLQEIKKGKVLLMTTHSMEEADTLGDRIIVLSRGKLQVDGSSMFLKQKHGKGYRVNFERKLDDTLTETEKQKSDDHVKKMIQVHFPGAYVESSTSVLLTFILPHSQSTSTSSHASLLKGLFSDLTEHITKGDLVGIKSVGIGESTLDDVFLKLVKLDEAEEEV